jgi:hypothetical protein
MLEGQNNTIMVEIRDVYGVSKVYPVCGEAQIFAAIAGTKTLLPEDIKRIQMLGYEVKVKQPQARELTNVM